ncbi:unnamed protein product [Euphydryas editha]|uniref:26S proteasome non-ATPase regulatory subunit 9 n=1 Tax=Euphydryas editha TaxID=104508 RepID=A0AAU9UJ13_EUPED|nr:unnamed protein product [Euphydryas editha]
MVGCDLDGPTSDQLFKLIEKDKIDSELCDVNCLLEKNNTGIQDSIIERLGFARNNIDIYKVRHSRHKIICLKNSHNNIMEVIKRNLNEAQSESLFAKDDGPPIKRSAIYTYDYDDSNAEDSNDNIKSFATVGLVQEGSPADLGGLCENDKILKFGLIDASNFSDIYELQDIVKSSIGKPLYIQVRRDKQILDLTVVPQLWERPGYFGCQIMKQWCIVRITT